MLNKLKDKEFLWNTFGQIIQMLGAIIVMKLLAIYLSKGEYGKFALLNSLVALFMILPFNAIIHGITRYVSEHMDFKRLVDFYSINIFMMSMIFLGIYMFIWTVLQFLDFELKTFFQLASLLVLSEIYKTMLRSIENARRLRKKIALSSLGEFMSKIVLIFILSEFQIVSVENILIVLVIGNMVSISGLMYNNWKNIHIPKLDDYHKIFIPIVLFGVPLIFAQLFGWVRDMSSRWFLEIYVNSESVAVFALMATMAAIIPSGLNGFIGSYLVPILYQKEHIETGYTKKLLQKIIPKLIMGALLLGVLVSYLKDFMVILFTDIKYVEFSWMLPPMFIVFSFYIISMIASYEIYSKKKTKLLLYPAAISAFIAFLSGFFLIKNYGLEGAFISYIMTYISYAIVIFYLVFFKKVENA